MVTDYQGLNMKQLDVLRKQMRKHGIQFKITKNRITKLALQNSKSPLIIDLLEWQEPSDDNPPYSNLYHLGIARIALKSDDLDSDVELLKSHGVEFLSEPAEVKIEGQPKTRFVCFKDPDGTILELVE